jgi:hypothetical protein
MEYIDLVSAALTRKPVLLPDGQSEALLYPHDVARWRQAVEIVRVECAIRIEMQLYAQGG